MRKPLPVALLGAALLLSIPHGSSAFPACDSFGQDWDIGLGPFGGSFPFTMLVEGCRDCDQSLGCGASLPLSGTTTITGDSAGRLVTVWSLAAFDPPADQGACTATHWNGTLRFGAVTVSGSVENEAGPFGGFSLDLGSTCTSAPGSDRDPSSTN